MKINELTIENFGRFKRFHCDLGDGINVIKGPNEAGKSTIVAAISTLLYGKPGAIDNESAALKNWSGSDVPLLKAELSTAGFSAIVEKNLGTGASVLKSDGLNLTIDDSHKIFEMISGAVGFPSAELFRATACVKQGEIARIDDSLEAIRDKLESLVTGGQQDLAASSVQVKIDDRIENITGADSGFLKRLEKSQSEIDYNIENLKRDIANLKTYRNSLAQVETAYANIIEDYTNKKQTLDQMTEQEKSLSELVEVGRELDEISNKLEMAKSVTGKISEIEKQLSELTRVSPEDRERIEEIESNLKYLRPKLRELEKEAVQAEHELQRNRKIGPLLLWAICALGASGFAVADYLLHFTGRHLYFGGAAVAFLMITVFSFSRFFQLRSFLQGQLTQKSNRLAESKKEYDDQTAELKALLSKYHINSAEQIRQIAWKRDELENQLRHEKELQKSALGESDLETLENRCRQLRLREGEIKEAIKISQGKQFDQAEINRLKHVVDQTSEQKSALENEIAVLRRKLETAEGGAELLASYLERKEELTLRKMKYVEELAILGLTKECVEIARQNIMISTLELLENRTSELLAAMTDGRYDSVRFDRASLKFKVFSKQKNDYVDPESELSRATADQVYLTARLALTEIMANQAKAPLILDEPFECLDPQRLDKTMKILKQLSTGRQILLLTSGNRLDSYADHLVELGA